MPRYVSHLYVCDARQPDNGVVIVVDDIQTAITELNEYRFKAIKEHDSFTAKDNYKCKRFTLSAPFPGPFHRYFVEHQYPELMFCAIMHGRSDFQYKANRDLTYHIMRYTKKNYSTFLYETKQFIPIYPFTMDEVKEHLLPVYVQLTKHERDEYTTLHYRVGQDNYS